MGAIANKSVLFISHNAADRPFAQALKRFIDDLLQNPDLIEVRYSTSDDTGPEGGEAWRDWIYRAVVEARTTLIVITPHALGKPWLLWEAGAVKGAALARSSVAQSTAKRSRKTTEAAAPPIIVSLAYGLPSAECPDPLLGEQIIQGTDVKRLEELFNRILQAHGIGGDTLFKAGHRIQQAFQRYEADIERAMQRAPSLINEANVQDWLKRLDTLVAQKRFSDLAGFERWMMLAFGRDAERDGVAGGIPIDVRLHRALGELHLGQKQYRKAVWQLRLAWRSAPRDIFVLRPLAEASMKLLLEGGDANSPAAREEIQTLLDAIGELDEHAYTANSDSAALLAKYHRRVLGVPGKARDIYLRALDANPDSYYLADLLAQTELDMQDPEAARSHFSQALEIVNRLGETNLWSLATAATACIALQRGDEARRYLERLREVGHANASQIDSIARGIREVAVNAGVADHVVDELLSTLTLRDEPSS